MKRRTFLGLLALAPAAPLIAKEAVKEAPVPPAPPAESALPPGCLYGSYGDAIPHIGDYYDGRFGSEPVWVQCHVKFGPAGTQPVTSVYVRPVRS